MCELDSSFMGQARENAWLFFVYPKQKGERCLVKTTNFIKKRHLQIPITLNDRKKQHLMKAWRTYIDKDRETKC